MKVGIIGAGAIGGTLARKLANLGHQVSIASSRGPDTLRELADQIGAKTVTARECARAGELVILSIPQNAVPNLPKDLFDGVPASVTVVDTGNYYPKLRDGRIEALESGMVESLWVAAQLGRPVVKAFNNLYAKSLREKGAPPGTPARVALSAAGNLPEARSLVLGLVDELGFDPVDAGCLDESWRQQPGTPAYCRDLDAASLKRALSEAEPGRLAEYRQAQEEYVAKLIAAGSDTGR